MQSQLQWVVGRNPFAQSTMWGEGYEYQPQYSVSVGDIVGSLPVGMMTRDNADAPYWPATNTYVFKEVWVHPAARWLSIMADVVAPARREPFAFTATQTQEPNSDILIAIDAPAGHTFTLRTDNLTVTATPTPRTWRARVTSPDSPWFAVAVADGNAALRREVAH